MVPFDVEGESIAGFLETEGARTNWSRLAAPQTQACENLRDSQ